MSRPKTSVDRLNNLRNSFTGNKSKVFTCKQVEETVGASYWRACVKDLKDEGLNIVAVRDGRNVVGYKLLDGVAAASSAAVVKKAASKPAPVAKAKAAAAKPKAGVKKGKTGPKTGPKVVAEGAAKVKAPKAPVKAAKSVKKVSPKKQADVASVVDEMDTSDEYDAEVQAILDAAGLGAK